MDKLFFSVLVLSLVWSCQVDLAQMNAEYNPKVSNFEIDNKLNYNQVIIKGLQLSDKTGQKVKNVLSSYRNNLKKNPQRVDKLKKNREKKLARLLSNCQLAQRKYINTKYYRTIPNNPYHPANIQLSYKLSDGQVMKLIEIEYIFKKNKDLQQKKKRILELMGEVKANDFLNTKGIII